MANPLNDFLTARSDKKPFSMTDESFLPPGEVTYLPEDKSAGIPIKGATVNAKGKVVAPIQGMQVSGAIPPVVTPEPVSPKVEQIKAIFSPQATVVEQPVAASNLIDMPKVQAQAAGMMPERSLMDLLPALAPLAVEALMGKGRGGGVSYGVAGKGVLDAETDRVSRQRSLEDKLMEFEKARAIAGAKSGKTLSKQFQSKNVYDKDTGKTYFINYNTSTGTYTYPDGSPITEDKLRTGFAVVPEEFDRRAQQKSIIKRSDADYLGQGVRGDPRTKELSIIRNGVAIPVGGMPEKEYNTKQEADVETMKDDFTKSPAYVDSVNSLAVTPTVTSLLDAAQRTSNPNSIAGNSVVLTMIRQAQKVGVASDRDAAALGGTQQWSESINRIQQKLVGQGGPLTIRDIQELREISEIYKKRSQNLLQDHYKESKKSYQRLYGFSPEQIDSQLGSKVNPYMSQSNKSIRSDSLPEGIDFGGTKQFPPKSAPNSTVPYSLDGKLFWAEPSDADNIKKEHPTAKRLK
jgi:hypothetical protein